MNNINNWWISNSSVFAAIFSPGSVANQFAPIINWSVNWSLVKSMAYHQSNTWLGLSAGESGHALHGRDIFGYKRWYLSTRLPLVFGMEWIAFQSKLWLNFGVSSSSGVISRQGFGFSKISRSQNKICKSRTPRVKQAKFQLVKNSIGANYEQLWEIK